MEEIYKLALTDNPVDLEVDKNLKVSSNVNMALPEEETFLINTDIGSLVFPLEIIIPENVEVIKVVHVDMDANHKQTFIKVSPNSKYTLLYNSEKYNISSSTGITYIEFNGNFELSPFMISYSASINKGTNIYNSDYINDDNYIYYYVSTGTHANNTVTTKHQVTKNATWQQAIDSGQNYAGITFSDKGTGYAECREYGTLDGAMYLNDIIKSGAYYGFHERTLN